MEQPATSWQCGGSLLSLETPTLVGILNATPDSFSDGGDYKQVSAAVSHAMKMVKAGATIIDVGGESTRPKATRVSATEQLARVIPVIEGIRDKSDVCISIDTTLAEEANMAIAAGATVINDVSAGEEDDEMFLLAANTGSGFVMMHRRLPPELEEYSHAYSVDPTSDDIVQEVIDWLMSRVEKATSAGISKNAIAIDPGLGFGKSVEQNWKIVENVDRLVHLGSPVYVGASRKSFIGATAGIDNPTLRDEASALSVLTMAKKGVQIFRVHNIPEHVRVLQSQTLNNTNQ